MNKCAFHLYSNDFPRDFQTGDRVFVWLHSERSTGTAVVIQTPHGLAVDSQFKGRYQVKFTYNGRTAHVRPERLFPVYREPKLILVTAATEDYRRLARSQVTAKHVYVLNVKVAVSRERLTILTTSCASQHSSWQQCSIFIQHSTACV